MRSSPAICVAGAGRMGQGIAMSFAYAGLPVVLIDMKERSSANCAEYCDRILESLRTEARLMVTLEMLTADQSNALLSRIEVLSRGTSQAHASLSQCSVLFEAVPELMEVKRATFEWLNEYLSNDAIVASTTSTFLVTELAGMVGHSSRFLNAHWLNPATLMPLVEVSRGSGTSEEAIAVITGLLKRIGKTPVLCNATPGYIVPRIQALAMNEAARMVEEGVASAQDIDTAVRLGFGLRFSVLGLLEFIDWGGGDILYNASRYLSQAIDSKYESPQVVVDNMHSNKNGLRDRRGFFDYRDVDLDAYRLSRLVEFTRRLQASGLAPAFEGAVS